MPPTYRRNLAKLRWDVEHIGGVTPSHWSMQDVKHFSALPAQLPDAAIGARGHAPDNVDWRPFSSRVGDGGKDVLIYGQYSNRSANPYEDRSSRSSATAAGLASSATKSQNALYRAADRPFIGGGGSPATRPPTSV